MDKTNSEKCCPTSDYCRGVNNSLDLSYRKVRKNAGLQKLSSVKESIFIKIRFAG